MKFPSKKVLKILIAITVLGLAWAVSLQHLNFETVRQMALQIRNLASAHLIVSFFILLLIHITGMFFTLPTKAIFTMVSGALLGFVPGAMATLAGTLAGTSALFFTAQKLVDSETLEKLPGLLKRFKARLLHHPMLTVASLRMILVLPYGAITIFCAITRIPYRAFLAGSVLGDIPVILLYSAAGIKLIELTQKNEAISFETVVLLSLAGIGLFAGSLFSGKRKFVLKP